MPDITMCPSDTCDLRTRCYRNPASGTKPSEYRQSWWVEKILINDDCNNYWPLPSKVK
jgi:hypothetical protein